LVDLDIFKWVRGQELKRKTRTHSAAELIRMTQVKIDTPLAEREEFRKRIEAAFESSGRVYLERAFFDRTLTEMEFVDIMDKHNLDVKDIGVVLAARYAALDQGTPKKERVLILTTPGSTIDQARKFILKKFKVKVVTTTEMMKSRSFQKFKKEQEAKK
jgi:hypothetical protein